MINRYTYGAAEMCNMGVCLLCKGEDNVVKGFKKMYLKLTF